MARVKSQGNAHMMARMTPYPFANALAVPNTFSGTAPKPGVPTSVVARSPAHAMAIPKPRAWQQ